MHEGPAFFQVPDHSPRLNGVVPPGVCPYFITDNLEAIRQGFEQGRFKRTSIVGIRQAKELFIFGSIDALADIDISLGKDLIEGIPSWIFWEQKAGGITLGVNIDDQHSLLASGQRVSEIHGYGGFSYTTLVIDNGDDLPLHAPFLQGI
jgi:hypothetical protein